MSGTLRVLPLGGVGEIGKNMTVVEYDGRIVVVDCGLRFPTAEMMGIDLVLPDFTYLRERVDDIEAIVITHGHEDHLGALPWVMRELGQKTIPVVYGGQLTVAMARSKLDEHKLRDVNLEVLPIGDVAQAGPFEHRAHPPHALDPGLLAASRSRRELGTVLFTGDYKFDQTPVGGAPADMARLAELGREGVLLLCGDSTNADRAGHLDSASRSSARTSSACSPAARAASSSPASRRTSTASSRSSTPPRRSTARSRWSGARCARTSTSAARSGHIDVPEGMLVPPREIDQWADEQARDHLDRVPGRAAVARCAAWPTATTRRSSCTRGDTVVFSATPIPGNERAVNETIDRLYHVGCDVITARDAPIHASGHGYAEELKMMLNLTRPRYVMPVHGDYKRMLLHGAARRGGRRAGGEHLPHRERHAAGDRRQGRPPRASRETAGMVFVDGVDIGDVADVALRDRRMLSADGIFIIVATVSEQDGSSVVAPEVLARGVPFLDGDERVHRRAARGGRGLAGPRRRAADHRDRRAGVVPARRPRARSSTSGSSAARWCCRSSSRSDAPDAGRSSVRAGPELTDPVVPGR